MALSAPQAAGDQLQPADIENHTLIVIPTQFHVDMPTMHSKKDETSPAIESHVVDFSDPSGVPVLYRGVIWWNVMLVNGLKRQIGQTVLGRMTKGQASTGKNPPWQLLDLLSNPAEKAWVDYAESFLAGAEGSAFEKEGQQVAGGSVISAPAPAAATPPPPPAPPSAPPAGPPATYAAPAGPPAGPPAGVPTAAPAAATPAPAAPAGDLASQLSGLPPEELQKMMAALQNQGQAAH